MPAPHPLTTPQELTQLLTELSGAPFIALDTEFRREDTYLPKLCLVQLATPTGLWLLDALALELTPLWRQLNQSATPIVLHAAQQDLELIALASGALPSVLHDTQLAAAFLGLGDQIGYAQLVINRLGISLDKSQSRTDWTLRPLSEAQRQYAADDVHYLGKLYPELIGNLKSAGRLDWFLAECAPLSDASRFQPRTTGLWRKVSGQQNLKAVERAALEAITQWRETQAIARNTPRRWILSDEAAIKLAMNGQPSVQDIIAGHRPGTAPADEAACKALLTAISAARQSPPDSWPHAKIVRLAPIEQTQLQRWQQRIAALCQDLKLSSALLATTDDLLRLLRHPEQENRLTQGWRADLIGQALQSEASI